MVSASPQHIPAVAREIGGEHSLEGTDRSTAGILLITTGKDTAQSCLRIEKGAGITKVVDNGVSPDMLLVTAAAAPQTDAVPLFPRDFPTFTYTLSYSHRLSPVPLLPAPASRSVLRHMREISPPARR